MAALAPPPSLDELTRQGPTALFLDFDGTLVAIAPGPDAIEVPRSLGGQLQALADRFDGRVAIVSGRSLVDLDRHIGPAAIAMAGSHGAERRLADGAMLGDGPVRFPDAVGDAVRDYAVRHDGVEPEAKSFGAALHYRAAPDAREAVIAFAKDLAVRHDLVLKHGKSVVELTARDAGKGHAVQALMAHDVFAGALPVFIGDDITDEDGFRAAGGSGGFGILVGERSPSAARYALADPAAVHHWLGLSL